MAFRRSSGQHLGGRFFSSGTEVDFSGFFGVKMPLKLENIRTSTWQKFFQNDSKAARVTKLGERG